MSLKQKLNRDRLHGYQVRAVDFIKTTPCAALWVDMGMGKTATTLTALADFLDSFEVGHVLVIAPLRVAHHTWPREIETWQHTRHLTYSVIAGTSSQRLKVLYDNAEIHIINRELVPWLVETLGKRWPYDMVVIDESSSFKSSKSKRFKALKKMLPDIDRMVQLTGTPASNGLLDVWSQMFLLDRGERLGRTFTGFKTRFFYSDYQGYRWSPRDGAAQQIYDRLSDICLTLSAEDYLQLPDRVDNVIELAMPSEAQGQYRELERDFLVQLGRGEVVANNAAALTGKLLQFCNGAVYTDDAGSWEPVHSKKMDALEDIVDASVGQPVLVAYNYRSDIARLKDRFPRAECIGDSSNAIDRWNAGEIPMLLAHPASAGHGLNLQGGGNIIVWFGLNWSLELYQQFNARLHRQGQTKPVVIHHLAVQESVDMTVLEALAGKHTTQKALLDALKQDIEGRAA